MAAQKGGNYDLTTCATLASCFDFQHRGVIDRDDWVRGTKMLLLSEMGEDDTLWAKLVQRYGSQADNAILMSRLADFVPMDPRVNLMMQAMVQSVAGVSDRLERQQKKLSDQGATRANRVILMMRRKIIEPVLHAWRDLVKNRLHNARKALRYALNSSLGAGFRQWLDYWEAVCEVKGKMEKTARRLSNRDLSRGWNQWFALYEQYLKLKAVGERLKSPGLSKAFNAWQEAYYQQKETRGAMRKGLARLVHREIIACWDKWSQSSLQQAENARKMRKLLRRWRNKEVADAWSAWMQLIHEREVNACMQTRPGLLPFLSLLLTALFSCIRAQALHRALNSALHSSTGKAFRRWEEMVDERIRLKDVATRVMKRMMNRLAASVFDAWYDEIREQVENREAAYRSVIIMMKLRMVQWCFKEWARKCVGIAQARDSRKREILGRIRHRAVVICLQEWKAYTQDAMKLRRYYAARWLNALLAKLFDAWRDIAHVEAGKRLKMRAMAIRMARRTEVIVLQEWHAYVMEAHSYMRAAMGRWMNEQLNAAFETWHDVVSTKLKLQRMAKQVWARYSNALLVKVVLGWRGLVADELERRASITMRAMEFLTGKQELVLKGRFETWSSWVKAEKDRRESLKRSVIMRVRNRLLAACWNMWIAHHQEAAGMRAAGKKWLNKALARGWNRWDEYVYQKKRLETMARIMVGRYNDSLLMKVFFNWKGWVKYECAHREAATLQALTFLSGRQELVMLTTLRTWRGWVLTIVGKREELARKALGRYLNQALTKCFLAWQQYVHGQRVESDQKILKAVAFWSGRNSHLLKLAFSELIRAVAKQKDEREALIQSCLLRMKYGVLHLAFSTWMHVTQKALAAKQGNGPVVEELRERVRELEERLESVERLVAQPPPAPPPAPAPAELPAYTTGGIDTYDLLPMVESMQSMGKAMSTLLKSMRGFTETIAETRLATELGGGGGGLYGGALPMPSTLQSDGTYGNGAGAGMTEGVRMANTSTEHVNSAKSAAEWIKERLEQLELGINDELDNAGRELTHSEKRLQDGLRDVRLTKLGEPSLEVPLHPLPFAAIDAAAAHTFTSELIATQNALATAKRELRDVHHTKAYRYELAHMRTELHSFLFNGNPAAAMALLAQTPSPPETSRPGSPSLVQMPYAPFAEVSGGGGGGGGEAKRSPEGKEGRKSPTAPPNSASTERPAASRYHIEPSLAAAAEHAEQSASGQLVPVAGSRPCGPRPASASSAGRPGHTVTATTHQFGIGAGTSIAFAANVPTGEYNFPRRTPSAVVSSAASAALRESSQGLMPQSARPVGRGPPAPPPNGRPKSASARTRRLVVGDGTADAAEAQAEAATAQVSGAVWASKSHFASRAMLA